MMFTFDMYNRLKLHMPMLLFVAPSAIDSPHDVV